MNPLALEHCPHCGKVHQTTCPRIRRLEYFEDGRVKAVELHVPAPAQLPPPNLPRSGEPWAPLSGPFSNE
jgi:hypothetical protein